MYKTLIDNIHLSFFLLFILPITISAQEIPEEDNLYLDGIHEEFYYDGQIASKTEYKDNILHGEQINYYPNGVVQSKFLYNNNRIISYQYYSEDGMETRAFTTQTPEDGDYVENFMNGQIKMKGLYRNGNPDGEFVEFYANGLIYKKYTFKNGKKEGSEETYYPSGALHYRRYYIDGKLASSTQELFENGKIKSETNYIDSFKHGEEKLFSDNGKLLEVNNYVNGKIEGIQKKFHANGKIESEYTLKDGQINGKFIEYFPSGEKKRERTFVNNIVQGIAYEYYPNGNVKKTTSLVNGHIEGRVVGYHLNGNIKSELEYKNGRLIDARYYYDDGQIIPPNASKHYLKPSDLSAFTLDGSVAVDWKYQGIVDSVISELRTRGLDPKKYYLNIRRNNNSDEWMLFLYHENTFLDKHFGEVLDPEFKNFSLRINTETLTILN